MKAMFYSVASFVISASIWTAEFFVALAVPGRQFRFLTIWGLTGAMCMHGYQMVRMRRSPTPNISALFTMAAAINLVILLMYWTAYFVFPHMIAVEGYHLLHDIFIHAICPLLCIIDTAFLSNALKDIKLSATYLQASILMYVLWLELFVAPYSILPYAFLRGVTMSARIVCYVGIALLSHFSNLLLHVCKDACSTKKTCSDQLGDGCVAQSLNEDGGNDALTASVVLDNCSDTIMLAEAIDFDAKKGDAFSSGSSDATTEKSSAFSLFRCCSDCLRRGDKTTFYSVTSWSFS